MLDLVRMKKFLRTFRSKWQCMKGISELQLCHGLSSRKLSTSMLNLAKWTPKFENNGFSTSKKPDWVQFYVSDKLVVVVAKKNNPRLKMKPKLASWKIEFSRTTSSTVPTCSYVFYTDHQTRPTQTKTEPLRIKRKLTIF